MAIEDYATCLDCTTLHLKSALTSNRCAACQKRWIEKRGVVLSKASDRAMTVAARELIMGLSGAGKGEPRSPAFVDAYIARMGGKANFGKICADQHWNALGCDPDTQQPIAGADTSPTLAFKYAEMFARVQRDVDAVENPDVSHLSDDDLVGTVRGLMTNLVQNSPEYRRLIVEEALRIQPDLLATASGGEVVDEVKRIDLSEIGMDEKDASEE